MAFTVTTTEADLALSKIIERRAAGISLHAISIQPTRNLHTLLYGDNITMKPQPRPSLLYQIPDATIDRFAGPCIRSQRWCPPYLLISEWTASFARCHAVPRSASEDGSGGW